MRPKRNPYFVRKIRLLPIESLDLPPIYVYHSTQTTDTERGFPMLTVYKHTDGELVIDRTVADATKGSWINMVNPDPDEIALINIMTEIPTDVLKAALDPEERSHVEIEENYIFVVINIPVLRGSDSYDTLPLGIFITPDFFITICLEESEILYAFENNQYPTFYTFKKTRFLFQILFRTATLYLRYLQQINRRTDDIEVQLRHTTKNKDFFQLLELQKSLTYFASALRTNGVVMEKMLRFRRHVEFRHLLKLYEEDEDLLEDVIIENKQAIEMVEMYTNILINMMDAFTSIISNNLNMVMKFLASMTIILSVPTVIFSFWGINVNLPFQGSEMGFMLVIGVAIFTTCLAVFALWKNDLL